MSRSKIRTSLAMLVGVALLGSGATLVYAQNLDIIKQRRETMRTLAGASTANFKMMKGDVPFDLAAFQTNMKTIEEQAAKFKGMFPDDSKTGGGTDATPKVWSAKAEFDGLVDKFLASTKSTSAAIKDEATFKASYPEFTKTCGGCHMSTGGFTVGLGESFKKPKP